MIGRPRRDAFSFLTSCRGLPRELFGVPQPDDRAAEPAAAFLDFNLRRAVILGPNAGRIGGGSFRRTRDREHGGKEDESRCQYAIFHGSPLRNGLCQAAKSQDI